MPPVSAISEVLFGLVLFFREKRFQFFKACGQFAYLARKHMPLDEVFFAFGRGAENHCTRGNTALNGGGSRNLGPVSERNMSVDAGLRGNDYAAADFSAAGDSALPDQSGGLPDDDIVGDMHQIVDLDAFLDPGLSEPCAVDCAVCADP